MVCFEEKSEKVPKELGVDSGIIEIGIHIEIRSTVGSANNLWLVRSLCSIKIGREECVWE